MKKSASNRSTAEKQRIVVVLGMHRSGTSAVTHALEAMGVDLGDHLMAAVAGVNDKGFFEDQEVVALNMELLAALGHDWHTLAPLSAQEQLSPAAGPFRLRAIELLRARLADTDTFGVKDPRMCRLLPFWQHVFAHLQLDDRYVIVARNPLSTARSLEKVHGLPVLKSHLLWLEHMLASVLDTRGKPRAVVDYDRILADPKSELRRAAGALGLAGQLSEPALDAFAEQFIEEGLRHAAFRPEDVRQDPLVPGPLLKLYGLLEDAASGSTDIDAPAQLAAFEAVAGDFAGIREVLLFVARQEREINGLSTSVHEKNLHIGGIEGEVARLSRSVQEKDVHIANIEGAVARLSTAVHEKDVHIANIEREVGRLAEAVQDKDVHIDNIEAALRDRDAAVATKDAQLGKLETALEERRRELGRVREEADSHGRAVGQLKVQNTLLEHRLARSRDSIGWALGKPVRALKGLGRQVGLAEALEVIPFSQLSRNDDGWRAEGDDPAFLLQASRAWHGLAGWYTLHVRVDLPEPCTGRIYFDTGAGFSPLSSIEFLLQAGKEAKVPLYIPDNCVALRFDPCDRPLAFKLRECRLEPAKDSFALDRDFSSQAAVYERIGGIAGNATHLIPQHDVAKLDTGSAYRWRAMGEDPHFNINLPEPLKPGWYMVELQVHTDANVGIAKLYFNYGHGFTETNAVGLPFESGVVAKRLVQIEEAPKQVRFDPVDGRSRFTIGRVHLAPVPAWFARDRMLKRLRAKSDRYQGLSNRQVLQKIDAEATKSALSATRLLAQRYGATFVTSVLDNALGYQDWIETVERPAQPYTEDVPELLAKIDPKPLISVIVPTYNTRPDWLRSCIESVRKQSYPHWELCIADDASPEPHVADMLAEYAALDARIKFTIRAENGHISRASNSALELATGDYVALLDHDDELAVHALLFVALEIAKHPSVKIIYSDEDKLNEKGERFYPHFKSDWNPDLFFAQNYVSHLGVYQRSLITGIGGFRDGVEGSQDHDLLLRCLPQVRQGEIVHIPRVLYHWRTSEGSTARDGEQKSYATDAGLRALKDFFDRQGPAGVSVEGGLLPNTYRVRWPVPQPEPLVTLMIPTRDSRAITEVAVRSILEKTSYPNYEILIIDNGSVEPGTLEFFEAIQREDARVRVVRYDRPFNYSAINNFGETQARGTLLGLVNNDIEVIGEGWLTEMVSQASRPEIGCVGAKLYYSNDTIQHGGVILGLGGVAGHSHKHAARDEAGYFRRLKLPQTLSAVTAACMVVRRQVYQQVGGLDETNLEIAFNDVDFCLRVRSAGYRNLWTPYAELYHHESVSRGSEDTPQKMERFMKEVRYMKNRWQDALARDPYYNPNLTHARENFSI